MRKILALLSLLAGIGLTYFLHHPQAIGGKSIPALGKLLNPYSGVWQNAENPTNYSDFNLHSDLVKEEVKIIFDDRMVPHIYANSLEDALFAQGYVEAYHRLFQMDVSSRAADGRLSEILGKKLLNYDKKQRRLGLSFAADNAVKGWKNHPNELKNLDAYTAGINHFIANLKPENYPIEYKLLNCEPSVWTNRHSGLILKAMTQTLAGYEEDIEMSNALRVFGEADFNTIYPDRNPKDIPVIGGDYSYAKSEGNIPLQNINLPGVDRPRSPDGVGSNNWAVSGSKSITGKPILANDPHLSLSLPSVWYEIAITTPEFSAHGVTLLGMPGIMIGFNEHIAWGETNLGHDMSDYYTVQWTDATKTHYMLDGQKTKARQQIEEYHVKGAETVRDTVRYTHWGPVVDDSINLALRWIAHDEATAPEFMTFVSGMACKNYDQYLAATSSFYAPAQNFIYADNQNEIGLRVNGNIPIKKERQGVGVSDGTATANGWQGFISRDQNPQERNPSRGYVSSCNQYSTSAAYPYYYNGNFEPYRGRMAHKYLDERDTVDVAYFKKMQNSTYSMLAKEALAAMMPLLDSVSMQSAAAVQMAKWNCSYEATSKAAEHFDRWFDLLHKQLWDEVYALQSNTVLPNPDVWVTVNMIGSVSSSKFYDVVATLHVETLRDLVNSTWIESLEVPAVRLSVAKNAQIMHLLKLPAFSEMTLTLGGTKHSLNAMQQSFGPSWRMIVALGDEPEAYGTYPGGQSGNPASPFYKNRVATWAKGEYDKLFLARKPADISSSLFSITISHEK
jgi:penicillin amidase